MKTETVQFNLEIPADVKRRLKSDAALAGIPLKDYASRALAEYRPVLNSPTNELSTQTAADVLKQAEAQERGQKRSTGVTIAAKSKPSLGTQRLASSARKGKGSQP